MRLRLRVQERLYHALKFGVFRRVDFGHHAPDTASAKMNAKALEKAHSQYQRAALSLASLKASNDFKSIEEHWENFLNAANKVFTKHLGKPHPNITPAGIGESALAYLKQMIAEAEKLSV
jgi:hypothetical protein